MKVHKKNLASRPIVSCSGSLLFALGVWIDTKLQHVAAAQATYIKSSFELKKELLQLVLPAGARIFISDARTMYTSIKTTPALIEIGNYLRRNERKFADIPIEERDPAEVSHIPGERDGEVVTVNTVPAGTAISNYAFDVTPARLVTGLITEAGVCEASEEGLAGLFPDRASQG